MKPVTYNYISHYGDITLFSHIFLDHQYNIIITILNVTILIYL